MPSVEHAAFVEWVRHSPEVVPPLLTELGVPLPPFERVTVQEPVLDQVAPTEYLQRFMGKWAHAIGVLKGCRRGFLLILSERGIPLGSQHHAILMNCTDPDQVLHWAKRALDATSPAAVFD